MIFGRLVRDRRIELGWKATDLARAAGLHAGVVDRIEKDEDIDLLSLRQLQALGEALGIDPMAELGKPDAADYDREDVRALGAMLHRAGRPVSISDAAQAFGWTINRVQAAVDQLGREARRSGCSVVRSRRGIHLRADTNSDAKRAAQSMPRTVSESTMSQQDVDLVLDVAECWGEQLCRPVDSYADDDRRRIAKLIDAGILVAEEHFVTLSPTTVESLKPVLDLLTQRLVHERRFQPSASI